MERRRSRGVLPTANRVLLAAGALGIVAMMAHICVNAGLRAFAGSPLTGTNEIVTYWYMPLVALFGFVAAQHDGGHTEARVAFDRLPRANRVELHVAGLALTGLLCAGFAWFGLLEALRNFDLRLTGGVTEVTMWPVTFAVPAAYAVLALQTVTEAALAVRRARDGDPRPDRTPDRTGERGRADAAQ
ncbi:TRAP transporter small permease [Nocardiopsis sp. HNM0947]|uniref:TRAP transporter small permease n=1 Tax=Nocardiopsis coralli TaxID=2772213 RepID=A0ABR9P240_9ACTN|nr:TRAP transporter small permease [Nocardiopsis coralli]MBE2997909.1 TRAP transporter small permease [Nocardiopsis coralli]